ncbi:E3 SUMO-protein ligase RanBP2-like, partial [Cyprinus carpio]|uniref:E3 SUMO-protein ligase RanBP2-like n=1 Tax=Cyprinus carpio TaxID=7962 RepID=A0A9Q9XKE3_CYPCA
HPKGFRFSFKSILSPSKSPSKLNQSQASVGTDDEQESSQEEQRDDQYFDPVVPLPDLVEVSTGEENEQVLFSHLAKLYCYDKDLSQWKERGIGNLKILQHYKTKRTRLVMRRDQVLKLCANHWIASNMNLEPMKRAEKAWIWNAFDFSEGQGKVEQLAVRFKLQETANAFKEVFEEAKTAQEKDTLLTPFSAFSKPDKRPGAKLGTQTTKTVVSPHKFVFGSDAVQKIFGSPSPSKEKSPVMIPSSKDEKTGASKLKTSGPAVSSQSFSIPTRDDDFSWSGAGATVSGNTVKEISLPEVEVRSGEEDEEILFKERAKLYRWDHEVDQWKERGVGDIKILFHPVKQMWRVLMRRERELKDCAKHIISQSIELKPMKTSANALVWTTTDYSEGDGKVEQLAVKFKTPQLVESFKQTFTDCQSRMLQTDAAQMSD